MWTLVNSRAKKKKKNVYLGLKMYPWVSHIPLVKAWPRAPCFTAREAGKCSPGVPGKTSQEGGDVLAPLPTQPSSVPLASTGIATHIPLSLLLAPGIH